MANFHFNPKTGRTGKCDATVKPCRFGQSQEQHGNSPVEARANYERSMESELLPSTAPLGARELNKLAKETDSPEILDQAVAHSSLRVRTSVLSNPHVTAEQLRKLADESEDRSLTRGALKHRNFAASAMTTEQFVEAARWDPKIGEREGVRDEQLAALDERTRFQVEQEALRNPKSDLSDEYVNEAAKKSWGNMQFVAEAGRLRRETIATAPAHAIYWGSVDRCSKEEELRGYSDWTQNNSGEYNAATINERLAKNPHTPPDVLDRLSREENCAAAVVAHPNTSPETRERLLANSPAAQRAHKLKKASDSVGGDLQKHLRVDSRVSRPYNGAPYTTTTLKFDTEKVKALGLDREDMMEVAGARGYNVRAHYNEETGEFIGEIDSSG